MRAVNFDRRLLLHGPYVVWRVQSAIDWCQMQLKFSIIDTDKPRLLIEQAEKSHGIIETNDTDELDIFLIFSVSTKSMPTHAKCTFYM